MSIENVELCTTGTLVYSTYTTRIGIYKCTNTSFPSFPCTPLQIFTFLKHEYLLPFISLYTSTSIYTFTLRVPHFLHFLVHQYKYLHLYSTGTSFPTLPCTPVQVFTPSRVEPTALPSLLSQRTAPVKNVDSCYVMYVLAWPLNLVWKSVLTNYLGVMNEFNLVWIS